MDDGWPSSRPYVIGSVANWAMFLFALWLLTWGQASGRLPEPAQWAIVLLLAVSVGAQFVAAYRLVARQDEFIRAINIKRIVAATGLTITLAVLAGLAEQFLAMPTVPMWFVYPLFWGMFGIVTPFIRDTRP
jgi:hypothetical protein